METGIAALSWLTGRRLSKVSKIDWSWFFLLDDGTRVASESPWRLLTADGIIVTSEDHGQQFGLPSPVDAALRVRTTVGENTVSQWHLEERSSDLFLTFSNNAVLQFLNLSCGHEGWRIEHGDQLIVCIGGGGVATGDKSERSETTTR